MARERGLKRKREVVQAVDEQLVPIPFGFQIGAAGAVVAGSTQGDMIAGDPVKNAGAGNYTLTLKGRPAACISGTAACTDMETPVDAAQVNWENVVSAGTFVVQTYTAGVAANPESDSLVGGVLWVKATKRSSRNAP